ncbi:MAG TPA: serine hydrolase domain-containing protein [Stellaceae bacterium]|jgi:CubicO group peptidase (beta-lactamase class C family)|nr:serine hydrolase domain-containing protein [Stellaceae bacterium]
MTSRADAQEQIDKSLRSAVEAREVPGVVAMATSRNGPVYEGAFGVRDLGSGTAMTRDTVFRIASMTKAITSVGAMQLVEEGKLSLDGPLPDIDPALSKPQVLDGFDAAGQPILRPAKRPITLKHLLTHTAGFNYEAWNGNTLRYVATTDIPSTATGKRAALRLPLGFDPGDRWEYGINIDWVGLLIEAASGKSIDVYLRERVFAPLGLDDTGFVPTAEQRSRQASVHQRQADGGLVPQPIEIAPKPEFYAGGGGLYSTGGNYLRFLQALLNDGSLDGVQILKPETVALMNRNQIGDLPAGTMKTFVPQRSNDVDFFPGQPIRWGLGYMMNMEAGPNGRSAGTVSWAGLFNSYYWLDPVRHIAGVILHQILPFADHNAVRLYGRFERGVYTLVDAG